MHACKGEEMHAGEGEEMHAGEGEEMHAGEREEMHAGEGEEMHTCRLRANSRVRQIWCSREVGARAGAAGDREKALDALKLASAPMVSSRTRKRNSLRRPARVGARPPRPAQTIHRTMHRRSNAGGSGRARARSHTERLGRLGRARARVGRAAPRTPPRRARCHRAACACA